MTLTTAAAVATLPAPARLTPRNVVCTSKVTDALNLPALAAAIPGADYNPRTFPGMIVRMSAPKAAALVFNSGKLVLTGLPHPDAIAAAFAAVLEDLRTAGADLERERDGRRRDLIETAAGYVRTALPSSSTTAAETTRRTLRERVRDWLNR